LVITDATRQLFQQYEQLRQAHMPDSSEFPPAADDETVSDAVIAARVQSVCDAAMRIHSYRCIEERRFMEPRVALHPLYWALTAQDPPAELNVAGGQLPPTLAALPVDQRRLLDVGCCFGTDLRALLVAGFQPPNVLGVDVQPTFIDLGLDRLFVDRPLLADRFAVADFLEPTCADRTPALRQFMAEGGVHVAYAGSVFHLLNESDCVRLAQALFAVLESGGVAFGRTVGLTKEGGQAAEALRAQTIWKQETAAASSSTPVAPSGDLRFLHTAASLRALLESVGFTDVTVSEGEVDMKQDSSASPLSSFRSRRGRMPGQSAMLHFTAVKPEV
jgi:SAM-dependent methyltransferase